MSESLIFTSNNKEIRYKELLPQIESLLSGESDLIANLANTSAALKMTFDFFWVGFYLVKENQLVVGPFQGPIACSRIFFGKGVCGSSWKEKNTIIVPDVNAFPGHIACNSESQSEIVVPILKNGEVVAVLDVDSDKINHFDTIDEENLNKLAECLSGCF